MQHLTPEYWNERYKISAIGWDLGEVSPPIKEYIDQLTDKSIKILIPGCGNGHEAEYLHRQGFTNVHLLDFASKPLIEFKKRVAAFPEDHLHQENFFEHQGEYDLIIEQTLFCAIAPSLRNDYVKTIKRLLVPKGKLVGVMFNCHFEGGPPFGGSLEEYQSQFSKEFNNIKMEVCHNSITPRSGNELFVMIENN